MTRYHCSPPSAWVHETFFVRCMKHKRTSADVLGSSQTCWEGALCVGMQVSKETPCGCFGFHCSCLVRKVQRPCCTMPLYPSLIPGAKHRKHVMQPAM